MNKKDLANAIEEGVYRAKTRRGEEIAKEITSGILWGIGILVFLIIGIALWNGGGIDFQNRQTTSALEPAKCNYPYVYCHIKYITKVDLNASREEENVNNYMFCGYQEANAFFENFKSKVPEPQYNKSRFFMECG